MSRVRPSGSKPSRSGAIQAKNGKPNGLSRRTLLWIVLGVAALIAAVLILLPNRRSSTSRFDGERALADLVRQVEFGPRVPGSEAHAQTLRMLVDSLTRYADRVGTQEFSYTDPSDTTNVYRGTNVVASFNLNPASARRIMLAAHWDTRAIADRDPNPANRDKPVPGANDGASGVAVLLEMARLFAEEPPETGVDIVLFDLEDIGREERRGDTVLVEVPFAVGSRYFAGTNQGYRPHYGILVDMVCDKNLRIPKERFSVQYAEPVVDRVWEAAKRVGASAFLNQVGDGVYDDHIPFLERRTPVIDLIHTPFPPYWHTVQDTPDKCSAESLKQIGDVLTEVVYSEE